MVPKRIQPYWKQSFQKKEKDNSLFEGKIICCDSNEFELRVVGERKRNFWGGEHLIADEEGIAIEACCKKCGNIITIFDSNCDGYEQCDKQEELLVRYSALFCNKCKNNNHSVSIKYEYPDIDELQDLGIKNIDNAFSWIWISTECNSCGTKSKNLIDYEAT